MLECTITGASPTASVPRPSAAWCSIEVSPTQNVQLPVAEPSQRNDALPVAGSNCTLYRRASPSASASTLAPRIKARLLIAIAGTDDAKQPEAKDVLRKAFDDAHVAARVEVFADKHGWCVPDMPQDDGKPIYNQADAERAWGELLSLYKTALA